jgi:hypothetical protein
VIKAEIYYYPKFFGHIAIKVINPQTRQEIFYDFGGYHDLEKNESAYSCAPIIIKLPQMSTDWDDFLDNADRSIYTCASSDNSSDIDAPTYNIFTNNCAHATQHFMHLAGYITKPHASIGLMPHFVAKQAKALVIGNFQDLREKHIFKHFNSAHHHEFSLQQQNLLNNVQIRILIESLINEIIILDYYSQNSGYLSRDKLILEQIKYNGSVESIERLLAASESLSQVNAIKLQQCITLLAPQSYLHLSIARLEKKAIDLKNRKHESAALNATSLVKKLSLLVEIFVNGESNYEEFTSHAFDAIEVAVPELEQHRGLGVILGNIALAVVGLGIFYLAAVTIHKAYTGSFLFFNKTATANLVEEIGKEILNPRLVNQSPSILGR